MGGMTVHVCTPAQWGAVWLRVLALVGVYLLMEKGG